MRRYYVGIIDGSDHTWGVRIPDLPGCHGGGASMEEAIADAQSAAIEWVATQSTRDRPIPKARAIDEVLSDPASAFDAKSETTILLPVTIDAGRTVRANVSFDAGLLEAIDQEAERRGLTRSAFLASAAREKIAET